MRVINEKTLDFFREATQCELCRARVARCDPHHYYPRGRDNGSRLDIPVNLVSCCRFCHRQAEDGQIPRVKVLAVIAKREGRTPEAIMDIINGHLRKEKRAMLEIHPVAYDFPEATPERYEEIRESIRENGVDRPVLVWQGKIVDGKTRFRACQELGIQCPEENLDGDEASAIRRAIRENYERRDMTDNERTMAFAKAHARLHPDGGAKRQANLKNNKIPVFSSKAPAGPSTEAQDQKDLAKQTGKSVNTIKRAVKVARKSPPKVQEAVAKDKVSIWDAAAVADLPHEEQDAALAKVEAGEAKTLTKASKKPKEEKPELQWDCRGRLIFDSECLERHHAAMKLAEKAEEISKILYGAQKLEDTVLARGEGQGDCKKIKSALWIWLRHHPGMVCPVCYGTGKVSEERADYILETVEMLTTDPAAIKRLDVLPNGEKCPFCLGKKWTLGLDTEKTVEDLVFAMYAPYRKDIKRNPKKAELKEAG